VEAEAAAAAQCEKLRASKNKQAMECREWRKRAETAEESADKRLQELKWLRDEYEGLNTSATTSGKSSTASRWRQAGKL
jgi:hypothetical protein